MILTNVLTGWHPVVSISEEHSKTDSLPRRSIRIDPGNFQNENILQPGEDVADKVKNNLFILAHVTKSECFVGEPIIVTYKLYSRLNAKSSIVSQPSLTGFSKKDLVNFVSLNASNERIGGKMFETHILRKTELIPLISGNLEIDPIELEQKIKFIKADDDSLGVGKQLSDFLNQKKNEEQHSSAAVTIHTRSTPLRIAVKDLPRNNNPIEFSGAVGLFSIGAGIPPGRKTTGEKVLLTIEVKGKGNLTQIEAPRIHLPNGIEFFGVKRVLTPDDTAPDFSTRRVFEYSIVFRQPGTVQIPAVSFSYFNPIKKNYKIIHSMPISIEVYENPKKTAGSSATNQQASTIPKGATTRTLTSKNAVVLMIIFISGMLALFWEKIFSFFHMRSTVTNKAALNTGDPSIHRAAERLKAAKEMLDKNEFSTYYHELNKTLWAVITEKISLLPTELSKGNIFMELGLRGWTPEENWNLELTMNEYERNLYVPGYKEENDYQAAYHRALQIIARLDQINRG